MTPPVVVARLEDLPAVLVPREAAAALRVHPRYLTDLIRGGKLRATNVGSSSGKNGKRGKPTYRIKREDVIAFMNGDTEQGREPASAPAGAFREIGKAAA